MILEIQRALKRIIERFIAQIIYLTTDASAGTNTITVESTRRFIPGDQVVIRNDDSWDAEVLCIASIPDFRTLVFVENLIGNYTVGKRAQIQKLIGFQSGNQEFLKSIYLGDPAVISHFPAITIDAKSRDTEALTLGSVSHTYNVDITVYVGNSAYYDSQYEIMHYYVYQIERSLFRSFYPLVKPYRVTILAEDANPGDTTIKVVDEEFFVCGMGWIFFESVDFLTPNRAEESLGNGVLQLIRPLSRPFSAGDSVIHPLVHIYDFMPRSTRYGSIIKGSVLKAAVISLQMKVAEYINVPYKDPLLS